SAVTFAIALLLYAAASTLFFLDVARGRAAAPPAGAALPPIDGPGAARPAAAPSQLAPLLLGLGAMGHAAYVTLASFVARVCPVPPVHFMLSVASLLAIAVYFPARRRFRIDALGLLVGPLGLAFLLGTFFLGKPGPEPKLSPLFIVAHVVANLLGVA